MNIAFIDAQNLHLGTTKCIQCSEENDIPFSTLNVSDCKCGNAWRVDFFKFQEYLDKKHIVKNAYFFLGFLNENNQNLYTNPQKAGFVIIFREHNKKMVGTKKGNVDTDIVFEAMKNVIDNKSFSKIILVSGDGDHMKTVEYLIKKERFARILFPNGRYASSLYNKLDNSFKLSLSRETVRKMIEYKK